MAWLLMFGLWLWSLCWVRGPKAWWMISHFGAKRVPTVYRIHIGWPHWELLSHTDDPIIWILGKPWMLQVEAESGGISAKLGNTSTWTQQDPGASWPSGRQAIKSSRHLCWEHKKQAGWERGFKTSQHQPTMKIYLLDIFPVIAGGIAMIVFCMKTGNSLDRKSQFNKAGRALLHCWVGGQLWQTIHFGQWSLISTPFERGAQLTSVVNTWQMILFMVKRRRFHGSETSADPSIQYSWRMTSMIVFGHNDVWSSIHSHRLVTTNRMIICMH